MKAAVCCEFGKPLVIEDVTLDPPQQGEVRMKIAATRICHSDLHAIAGTHGGKLPRSALTPAESGCSAPFTGR